MAKVKIKKNSIEETFILPLWGRAYETSKENPRIVDKKAVEIISKIDYDFTDVEKTQSASQHGWVARSIHTDRMVKNFLKKHPKATIVNIGCGMDTTFSRVDNGHIMFYELDLPDVIEVRKNFYEDSDRHKMIASSFMDIEYFENLKVEDAILFLAGGVFMYFSEREIKKFFKDATNYFKNCDFYFDSLSPKILEMAKKKVLDEGGVKMQMGEGWGLKPIKSLEDWDPRFKVMEATPIYKGVKKGAKFKDLIMISMSDLFGFAHMVHLRARS